MAVYCLLRAGGLPGQERILADAAHLEEARFHVACRPRRTLAAQGIANAVSVLAREAEMADA